MTPNNSQRQRASSRGFFFAILAVTIGVIVAMVVGNGWLSASQSSTPDPSQSPQQGAPVPELAQGRDWDVTLRTSVGDISFTLDGAAAPAAAASFIHLAGEDFFDASECHRLLPGSLLQCGDPTGSGRGGPDYRFGPVENAPSDNMYRAGTVAMARVGGDAYSMGSQFFLVFEDVFLPADRAGGYSVIGTIDTGLEVLKDIAEAGTVDGSNDAAPKTRVIIESVEVK